MISPPRRAPQRPRQLPRLPRPGSAGRTLVAALLPLLAGTSCNRYEFFNLAGYEQASFKNDVDVVFIIDNSPSMMQEAEALALNFNTFITQLADPGAGGQVTETLSDAVDNYISYTSNRTSVLDYQLGITTTTVTPTEGTSTALEPGEAGTLVGPVVSRGDPDVAQAFLDTLLCDTTNWDQSLLSQDDWNCDDPGPPEQISEAYLDCRCGDTWRDNQGGGNEQPLEAALLTLCRATPDPPEVCFHTYAGTETGQDDDSTFGDSDIMSEPDIIRENSTVVFVVVTDEGDNSTQFLSTGDEDASFYLTSYDQFPNTIHFAVIGPRFDEQTRQATACEQSNGAEVRETVPYWSVRRLHQVADETAGLYADITQGPDITDPDAPPPCEVADFAEHLERIGQLLVNLSNVFPLSAIPDVSTIRVFVEGDEVPQAMLGGDTGAPGEYTSGWSYDPSQNAIVFWGDAVPDYNADVRIYYRPLEGKPRSLPF
ncbi:MAG: hypothetical protein D6798_11870 [Deltaproteobacteria bacterium]|nr:MAG: hypothetical protein D6798_11870 [Deltaproteobacteria bacterium]